MRLNPDCIRDMLFWAEQQCDGVNRIGIPSGAGALLEKYSKNDLLYHAKQCAENGLFTDVSAYYDGEIWLRDLSPKGHEFIANIRSNTVWEKVKRAAPGSIIKMIELAATLLPVVVK